MTVKPDSRGKPPHVFLSVSVHTLPLSTGTFQSNTFPLWFYSCAHLCATPTLSFIGHSPRPGTPMRSKRHSNRAGEDNKVPSSRQNPGAVAPPRAWAAPPFSLAANFEDIPPSTFPSNPLPFHSLPFPSLPSNTRSHRCEQQARTRRADNVLRKRPIPHPNHHTSYPKSSNPPSWYCSPRRTVGELLFWNSLFIGLSIYAFTLGPGLKPLDLPKRGKRHVGIMDMVLQHYAPPAP